MYNVEFHDNKVPLDIHTEAYNYLQGLTWESRYRNVPSANINPLKGDTPNDLIPYVAKKTIFRTTFGHDYESMSNHTPIADLYNFINDNVFDGKFEFNGKPIGTKTYKSGERPLHEEDDLRFEEEHQGVTSYMQAQPYETVKRTRLPHRDWDNAPLDSDRYYTMVFVANLIWDPIWHAEMFFYDNDHDTTPVVNDSNVSQVKLTPNACGWHNKYSVNMPGRIILFDSRTLHSSRATSVLAPELSQRIGFRVKLKEGATL